MKAMKASDISPAMISAMGVPMSALGHTAGVQPFADARHEDEREHEAETRRHRVEQRGGQVVLLALHEDGHAHHRTVGGDERQENAERGIQRRDSLLEEHFHKLHQTRDHEDEHDVCK